MSILFRSTTTYTDYRKSEHQNQTNRKDSIYIWKRTYNIPFRSNKGPRRTCTLTMVRIFHHERTFVLSRAYKCTLTKKSRLVAPSSATPSVLVKLFTSPFWQYPLFAIPLLPCLRETKTTTATHKRETTIRTTLSTILQSVRRHHQD